MEGDVADIVILGAGVIGLAIGSKLKGLSTVILESHEGFGRETSSRNSEVIHSGIYYPPSSEKTKLCLAGQKMLYEYCQRQNIPFAKTGKYVVATTSSEEAYLEKLYAHCKSLGIRCEKVLGGFSPLLKISSAILFPDTGIVDSHSYMASLERECLRENHVFAYRHKVRVIQKSAKGFRLDVETPEGMTKLECRTLINAAGISGAQISNGVLGGSRYEHRLCRGRYFTLSGKFGGAFKSLVYPVPEKDGAGVHVTIDLNGQAKLGPDVEWVPSTGDYAIYYDCNWENFRPVFTRLAQKYCPSITENDLSPGLIGIRPKLFVDNQANPDFLIEKKGNFIHCLGIESPGLTASLAIAEKVVGMI